MQPISGRIALLLQACVLALLVGCSPKTTVDETGESTVGSGVAEKDGAGVRQSGTAPTSQEGMAIIPAGEFIMGEPDRPRRVMLAAFAIDRTEVSNAEYGRFLDAAGDDDSECRHPDQPQSKTHHVPVLWDDPALGRSHGDLPVVGVDWFDAYAYAKWAGKRLPTEAEWERAARGTDGRIYPWGSEPPEGRGVAMANFFGHSFAADGYKATAPVDALAEGASAVGCLNMAGNVMEWTADWYGPAPKARKATDPRGPATGTSRVTKGGAWNVSAACLRSYRRWPMDPAKGVSNVGFRCAKDMTVR